MEARTLDVAEAALQTCGAVEAGAAGKLDSMLWNGLALERSSVEPIARDLTEAALLYPGDPDLLHNLAVLFDVLGDTQRAQKARTLLEPLPR